MGAQAKSVIVVGGGISGMSAALVLARHGCQVELLEKKPRLGPLLRGFSRGGVHFETGLHYVGGLHPQGALHRYFRLLGLENLPLISFPEDCFDRIRFGQGGLEIDLPIGKERLTDQLCGYFPAEAAFIHSYFTRLQRGYLDSNFLNFGEQPQQMFPPDQQQQSLASVLKQGTQNKFLRAVLSIHCLLHGTSPEETPFIQHARVAGSYLEGVKTIAGGGRALVAALEKRLEEEGVSRRCGVAVAQISMDENRLVSGVSLEDGDHLAADGVLFTGHPALLPLLLPPGACKPAFIRRLNSLLDTFSTYTLFGKYEGHLPSLQGNNLFLCPDADLTACFEAHCLPEQGPFYIPASMERAGNAKSLIAIAPGSFVECAPFAELKNAGYTALKQRRLEDFRQALLACCPELTCVDFMDGGTPLTNRDFLSSPGGGLYGARHSLRQFNPLPPTRIPNLWLAGQSVIAPGILGAVISAFIAAGFIVGMDKIGKEITSCPRGST